MRKRSIANVASWIAILNWSIYPAYSQVDVAQLMQRYEMPTVDRSLLDFLEKEHGLSSLDAPQIGLAIQHQLVPSIIHTKIGENSVLQLWHGAIILPELATTSQYFESDTNPHLWYVNKYDTTSIYVSANNRIVGSISVTNDASTIFHIDGDYDGIADYTYIGGHGIYHTIIKENDIGEKIRGTIENNDIHSLCNILAEDGDSGVTSNSRYNEALSSHALGHHAEFDLCGDDNQDLLGKIATGQRGPLDSNEQELDQCRDFLKNYDLQGPAQCQVQFEPVIIAAAITAIGVIVAAAINYAASKEQADATRDAADATRDAADAAIKVARDERKTAEAKAREAADNRRAAEIAEEWSRRSQQEEEDLKDAHEEASNNMLRECGDPMPGMENNSGAWVELRAKECKKKLWKDNCATIASNRGSSILSEVCHNPSEQGVFSYTQEVALQEGLYGNAVGDISCQLLGPGSIGVRANVFCPWDRDEERSVKLSDILNGDVPEANCQNGDGQRHKNCGSCPSWVESADDRRSNSGDQDQQSCPRIGGGNAVNAKMTDEFFTELEQLNDGAWAFACEALLCGDPAAASLGRRLFR